MRFLKRQPPPSWEYFIKFDNGTSVVVYDRNNNPVEAIPELVSTVERIHQLSVTSVSWLNGRKT